MWQNTNFTRKKFLRKHNLWKEEEKIVRIHKLWRNANFDKTHIRTKHRLKEAQIFFFFLFLFLQHIFFYKTHIWNILKFGQNTNCEKTKTEYDKKTKCYKTQIVKCTMVRTSWQLNNILEWVYGRLLQSRYDNFFLLSSTVKM